MNEYEERLINLEKKIDIIENKLDYVINRLDNKVVKSCDNMNKHISFIENVYEIVKYPLFFVINKINLLTNLK